MTGWRAAPYALALLGLGACSAEPPAPDPVPFAVWCSWISNAEASAALGAAVTITEPPGPSATCSIASEPRTFSGSVDVVEGRTLDSIVAGRGTAEPVEGLGERAAWVSAGRRGGGDVGGLLGVEQGGHGITILLLPAAPQTDLRARAEALARAILAELTVG